MATEAADRATQIADEMHTTVEAYVMAQNRGDPKAVLEFFHKSSPTYESTRQMLHQVFLNYKLKNELLGLSFVGTDDPYAYVRIRQRTEKVEGPDFMDNVTDLLVVLRQDEDAWKIWAQALLGAEAVQPGNAAGER